jgi:uncharacterized protein
MLRKPFFILLFTALVSAHHAFAENVPQPVGWVNDFANVIPQEYRDKLNTLIGELKEKTSAEIAVVTVTSIAPYDEKEYARMLFDSWRPGKKGKDNGVLILLAIKERRWRIETGYGVEGILPDGRCGEIGRNYMVPYFKNGNYGLGLYNGAAAIANIVAKDAGVTLNNLDGIHLKPVNNNSRAINGSTGIFKAAFFILIIASAAPFYLSLPLALVGCAILFFISRIASFIFFIIFSIVLLFRLSSWYDLPKSKRSNFFTYAGSGSSGSGGGGFGGGFGGGGFGGGGGGGGGAGGGF